MITWHAPVRVRGLGKEGCPAHSVGESGPGLCAWIEPLPDRPTRIRPAQADGSELIKGVVSRQIPFGSDGSALRHKAQADTNSPRAARAKSALQHRAPNRNPSAASITLL